MKSLNALVPISSKVKYNFTMLIINLKLFFFSRLVYKWFYAIHKGTTALSLVGYFIIMFTLFGVSLMFAIHPDVAVEFGLVTLFYGLYFGVLGRDFAEICADKMASKIGVSFNILYFVYSLVSHVDISPSDMVRNKL